MSYSDYYGGYYGYPSTSSSGSSSTQDKSSSQSGWSEFAKQYPLEFGFFVLLGVGVIAGGSYGIYVAVQNSNSSGDDTGSTNTPAPTTPGLTTDPPCGGRGQLPCEDAEGAKTCSANLIVDPDTGLCKSFCGAAGQPPCEDPDTGTLTCTVGTRNVEGTCQKCGAAGQVPCLDSSGLEVCSNGTVINDSKCVACGGEGQVPCKNTSGQQYCLSSAHIIDEDGFCQAKGLPVKELAIAGGIIGFLLLVAFLIYIRVKGGFRKVIKRLWFRMFGGRNETQKGSIVDYLEPGSRKDNELRNARARARGDPDMLNHLQALEKIKMNLNLTELQGNIVAIQNRQDVPHAKHEFDKAYQLEILRKEFRETSTRIDLLRNYEKNEFTQMMDNYNQEVENFVTQHSNPNLFTEQELHRVISDEAKKLTGGATSLSLIERFEFLNIMGKIYQPASKSITMKPTWASEIADDLGTPETRQTIFLYGPGGTGKTAYYDYLQETQGTIVLRVNASTLNASMEGGGERSIESFFAIADALMAQGEKVVLLFDEADEILKEQHAVFKRAESTHPDVSIAINTNAPLSDFRGKGVLNALLSRFSTLKLVDSPDISARVNVANGVLGHLSKDKEYFEAILSKFGEHQTNLRAIANLPSSIKEELEEALNLGNIERKRALMRLSSYLESQASEFKSAREAYVE